MDTQEVLGLVNGDSHRLRLQKNGTMQNVLDLLSSPEGVPTVVLPGSGISVNEVADRQYVVSNTAQYTPGPAGADSAFQTVAVSNGSDWPEPAR